MGDKSPRSKERSQKQKSAAQAERAAGAKVRQDSQSRQPPAKDKK